MDKKEFESTPLWDSAAKLCNLTVGKDGGLYGNISPAIKLIVKENKFSKTEYDKYVAKIVPVKFKLKSEDGTKKDAFEQDLQF